MPLLKRGTKTLEREALKTGLNIAGDVVQGINIKQAATSQIKPVLISCIRMSWDVQVPFLSEMSFEVFLAWSADVWSFFRLAGPFRTRCPVGPTVSIAFCK
jgi:hypothetical protein